MSVSSAKIVHVREEYPTFSPEAVEVLDEEFHIKELPLINANVEIEIKNVSTAFVNSLRRVVMDEMRGQCLWLPNGGLDMEQTTDPFVLFQFIKDRLALIPLRPRIPDQVVQKLRFSLDISNTGVAELLVFSRDLVPNYSLKETIFNPTFPLAELQPGARLVLKDIRITKGYGYHHVAYQIARRASHRHLDIKQFSDEDMRLPGGAAVDLSGYKASSLVANPRHHIISAVIPSMPRKKSETTKLFADACHNLKTRLRLVANVLDRHSRDPDAGNTIISKARFTMVRMKSGSLEGLLQIPGETHSIGEILRRSIFEVEPEIDFVAYTLATHERILNLKIRHSVDVMDVIKRAVKYSMDTFETLEQQFLNIVLNK